MKIITILFILMATLQIKSNKLEVAIENEKENILTLGVDNPLTALIESTSKRDVVLTTNNGTIEKAGGNRFIIHPANVGVAIVNVCKLVKKDTVIIDKREFRVHRLPEPEPYVGNKNGGHIKKKILLVQGGIRSFICCDFDAPVQILEYSLLVIRDTSTIGINQNIGARYTEKTIELLNRLQPNEHLLVYNLICNPPDGITTSLHPMEFIIEE